MGDHDQRRAFLPWPWCPAGVLSTGQKWKVRPDAVFRCLAGRSALPEHLSRHTAKPPEAFVFLSSQGKHLRRSNFNRWVWQPATRAAGVEGLRVHELRHTAGTLATAAGGSLREVMDRLGHFDHHGSRALPARHGRPGRGYRPGAEPADQGHMSAAMARRAGCTSLEMEQAGHRTPA
jgi:hypothetical protein